MKSHEYQITRISFMVLPRVDLVVLARVDLMVLATVQVHQRGHLRGLRHGGGDQVIITHHGG